MTDNKLIDKLDNDNIPVFSVSDITGATELAATPADTDEFVLSDAGTLKRIDYNKFVNLRKVHTITASDDSNVTFNSTYITSTFKRYTLEIFDLQTSVSKNLFGFFSKLLIFIFLNTFSRLKKYLSIMSLLCMVLK